MSDQVRNYRSRLFRILRVFFFTNLACSILFLVVVFYYRKRVTSLEESVRFLARVNVGLQDSFHKSLYVLTNDYFNISSSFVSNVVSSSASLFSSPEISSSSPSARSFGDGRNDSTDLPPLEFHSYGECDNRPFVMSGNKVYFEGDMLLGFPIQFISPSVVVYREKYFKVNERDERTIIHEIFKK